MVIGAMHAGMGVLKPMLAKSTGTLKGRTIIGTVKGDLHDIGKNVVGMLLAGIASVVTSPQIALWLPSKLIGW